MIFLTVGTQFSFDRLVKAVDEAVGNNGFNERLFAQIGTGAGYKPQKLEYTASLSKEDFDKYFKQAAAVISHGGVGTITMALEHHKPLLVMPRLKKYGEVVNDHQVDLAKKFEAQGHILVAYNEQELPEKLHQLGLFSPRPRQNQIKAVAGRIAEFLKRANNEKYNNIR